MESGGEEDSQDRPAGEKQDWDSGVLRFPDWDWELWSLWSGQLSPSGWEGRGEDRPGTWRKESGSFSLSNFNMHVNLLALFKADSGTVGLECGLEFHIFDKLADAIGTADAGTTLTRCPEMVLSGF